MSTFLKNSACRTEVTTGPKLPTSPMSQQNQNPLRPFREFLSHPSLGDLLIEEDQNIFKHLSSIEVEDFKDVKSGYSITFNFNPNPFFEETKLTKTFTFLDEGTTKIAATSIKWKQGMGVANGVANDKKGTKRPHAEESFFSWFSETQQKDDLDEIHDEVAEIIKEDLWPNPLTYFNNEADEEEFEGDEGDEEEKGSDGSDDDDDEQDEDDDDGDEGEGN
ncbi:NAP1-related protein 2 isoform X2 [Cornus florida]|uniref:NAP1-related protein 2 isoform X2 n=1 Tax=Cornus florida TaxID=4283 RepID=UPI0028A095D9|nr:NAP1-related protein 2 isoform X2 [Cornus florida]